MPTLENDRLVFRFPSIEEEANFAIDFQRTLRIPDSDRTYPLPPGLGQFPLRHAEDHAPRLPTRTAARGGVILPIWQAEAMWLNFSNRGPDWDLPFPVAVKVAAGKINAVSGETWRPGLRRDPQDYLVSPEQPWLDGLAVERGVIRQFVAMPLGEGYSAEEQLTGRAEWGGLQISVCPLRKAVWDARREAWERRRAEESRWDLREDAGTSVVYCEMALAPGGRMRQSIAPDPFELDDWDTAAAERVFVTLVHAKDWKAITFGPVHDHPPTARDYTAAGLPWFEHYGVDRAALPGAAKLGALKSVGTLHKLHTGAGLPNAEDVEAGVVVPAAIPSRRHRPIASGDWDG